MHQQSLAWQKQSTKTQQGHCQSVSMAKTAEIRSAANSDICVEILLDFVLLHFQGMVSVLGPTTFQPMDPPPPAPEKNIQQVQGHHYKPDHIKECWRQGNFSASVTQEVGPHHFARGPKPTTGKVKNATK